MMYKRGIIVYHRAFQKHHNIYYLVLYIQGGPKEVSHYQFFKKIVLKIANEIRFLRKVKV